MNSEKSLNPIFSKVCKRCLVEKISEDFHKKASSKDGLHVYCKQCKSILDKEYRECNRDRLSASRKKYREENKEKISQSLKSHYERNKEKYREAGRNYRDKNKESIALSKKKWCERNRKKVLESKRSHYEENKHAYSIRMKIWRKNNPEKASAYRRNYEAIKIKADGSHSGDDVKRILALQKNKCAMCRIELKSGYHVDHINPLSKGGSNWPENLQILCQSCNQRKHSKNPVDFAQEMGFLL